ncbi:hypothetical protein C8R44DRAFT_835029 [Mycena epipterygia]|nr:hypothetical protein C8R44DRAFT_835029 [Mycena epipterygia]
MVSPTGQNNVMRNKLVNVKSNTKSQRSHESDEDSGSDTDDEHEEVIRTTAGSSRLPAVPPLKQQCRIKQDTRLQDFRQALNDIQKIIKSKKTDFDGGANSLQEHCAQAIQTYLVMVVKRGCLTVEASESAAESQGFAAKWGGRSMRKWTHCRHAKVYSLLDDPAIKAELRAFVRSKKWSMDTAKLADFQQQHGTLIPMAADKYLRQIVQTEMELELFQRLQLKVGSKGISLSTARRCGHIPEAGETLEYGKNYDGPGYWTGELFCKQLRRKIIPSFEARHSPGYQALIIVDNSQGHSAYAPDTLLVSRMNTKPHGKQARMRPGWFIKNGERVKKYLREHCDYTFETLKENMPKALASVQVATIRRWEHRMVRWMDAYRSGMETQAAQLHVRKLSSNDI